MPILAFFRVVTKKNPRVVTQGLNVSGMSFLTKKLIHTIEQATRSCDL